MIIPEDTNSLLGQCTKDHRTRNTNHIFFSLSIWIPERNYPIVSHKLNECIIGALVMKNLSQDILNGFVQFYNTISLKNL